MGIVDLAKRAMKAVFAGHAENAPVAAPPPAPSETVTVTRIRGVNIDVSESLITSAAPSSSLPAVVIAFLDGRRVPGRLYNFSASRDVCQFLSSAAKSANGSEQIDLKQLKAIFFLREQPGPSPVRANPATATVSPGRRLEVIFSDNERLLGTTTGYTPDRLGFFLVPHDPTGKILRVFVINANTKQVKWL